MIRVGDTHGFTIVETLIFLAVSSALFASAMMMMSGQQAKTEFRQAVGEVQSTVDDVANDVATGYYSTDGQRRCGNFFGPSVDTAPAPSAKGTNSYCIFLGRFIQFGAASADKVGTYSIIGRRLGAGDKTPSKNLGDALASLVITPGAYDTTQLPGGLTAQAAFYQNQATPGSSKVAISGVAFVSSLGAFNPSGSLMSGSMSVDVIAIPGSLNLDTATLQTQTNSALQNNPPTNPAGGITVCFDSGGTDQHMILRIGTSGNLATSQTIKSGKSAGDSECRL